MERGCVRATPPPRLTRLPKGLKGVSRRLPARAACGLLLGLKVLAADGDTNTTVAVWDAEAILHTGAGYKDNLLYDRQGRESSAFVRTGFEASATRISSQGSSLILMVEGEDLRFLDGQSVDKEQLFFAMLQHRLQTARWTAGCEGTYVYSDQVFDSTVTETNLSSARALGHRMTMAPALARSLTQEHRLELRAIGSRQFLEAPLDDYWEGGTRLGYDWACTAQSNLELSYEYLARPYDHRLRTDADGYAAGESGLVYFQHKAQLGWRRYWDDQKRWRTTSKAAYERNEDNGSGFFNYDRYQFVQGLRWNPDRWEATLQLRFNYYAFDRQFAAAGAAERRQKTTLAVHARLEHSWAKWLGSYLDYEYETSLSNLELDEYSANMLSGGLFVKF